MILKNPPAFLEDDYLTHFPYCKFFMSTFLSKTHNNSRG